MSATRNSIAHGVSLVVTTAFLSVLGWYLFQPGYSWTRLVLFVALGGLAVVGGAGVWFQRLRVVAASAAGLLLLTVSVAGTLWLFILPVVIVLGAAAAVTSGHEQTDTPAIGQ